MTNSAVCAVTASFPPYISLAKNTPETGEANGNDYFGARYDASSMGRFMSPDWSAKIEPVP
jgi:hypothetical protein